MTITAEQIYRLNNQMGRVASNVQLGTLIQNAENVTAGEIAIANGKVLIGNASGVGAAVTLTGDVTTDNTGLTAIGAGKVLNAMVGAAAAIDFSKLAALTSTNILVGSSGNVATSVAVTGDVTIGNTGVTAIGAAKVTLAMLAAPVMLEATGTLSQANITGMNSSAVNLIAAPGVGKMIVIDEIELLHTFSTSAYTNGGVVAIQYTGSTAITKAAATLVTVGSSETWVQRPTLYDLDNSTGTGKGLTSAALANLGVEITNATAAFAAGNVANIIKWRVRYHVQTLLT